MKILFIILPLIVLFQGCESKTDTQTQEVVIDERIPFPPINNYTELDPSLKPPTLSLSTNKEQI